MDKFKKKFYLIVAHYFAFWARLALRAWRPEVILVTGSSGKTTVFYLLEAQLGEKAYFAHDANSAYGVSFNILGLERRTYSLGEWLALFLRAPLGLGSWRGRPGIYVVEADAERPGEADFIQKLLRPKTVIITNIHQTHAAYFDDLVANGQYPRALDAIAAEFVKYLRGATRKSLLNADNQNLLTAVEQAQLPADVRANLVYLQEADYLREYKIYSNSTQFVINGQSFTFPYFLPKEVSLSIEVTRQICEEFGVRMQRDFAAFRLPPGRGTFLRGIKDTTLIDSTYNANLGSMTAILEAFAQYPAAHKWLVLGEFREQGREAAGQHEQLARYILARLPDVEKVALVSPELREWVYPLLRQRWGDWRVKQFDEAGDAYVWLRANLQGGETLLLKGSQGRHLEGIVEGLLADRADAVRLSCRNAIYRSAQEAILNRVPETAVTTEGKQ